MLKERASAVKDALFAGDASAAEEYMAIYQIEGGTRTYHDDRVVAAAVSDFEAAQRHNALRDGSRHDRRCCRRREILARMVEVVLNVV
jgi:hypothetical protein